jgi:hypothetical protein
VSVPAFDWTEYLDLAAELARRRGDPAAERSAISRACYAAFHAASDHFVAAGERLTLLGEDHVIVWDWFLASADRRLRSIGANGKRLRRWRRVADYEPVYPGLSGDVPLAVALARRVVDDLNGIA